MTTDALDLPDTSQFEDDDAEDEPCKALRAHRRVHHHHPAQGYMTDCGALTEHALEAMADAQKVATSVLVKTKPCTRLLLRRLHKGGVQILLPVLGPRLARCWGLFQGGADLAERSPGRLPEPNGPSISTEAAGQVDVLIIPTLTVDGTGHRLGQDGGWYDRMLPLRSPEAHIFAVLHPEELVPGPLPMEKYDGPADAVIVVQEWLLLTAGSPAHAMSPES